MECPILLAIDTTERWEGGSAVLGESELAIEIATRPDGTKFKRLLVGDGRPAGPGLSRLRAKPELVAGLDGAEVQAALDGLSRSIADACSKSEVQAALDGLSRSIADACSKSEAVIAAGALAYNRVPAYDALPAPSEENAGVYWLVESDGTGNNGSPSIYTVAMIPGKQGPDNPVWVNRFRFPAPERFPLIRGAGVTEVTHGELLRLIAANALYPGAKYLITDFRTCYRQPVTGAVYGFGTKITPIEPLIVTAMSANELEPAAFSPSNPCDVIYYDAKQNNTGRFEWAVEGDRGQIYRRVTKNGNDTPYDSRAVKFRRWALTPPEWAEGTYAKGAAAAYGGRVYVSTEGGNAGTPGASGAWALTGLSPGAFVSPSPYGLNAGGYTVPSGGPGPGYDRDFYTFDDGNGGNTVDSVKAYANKFARDAETSVLGNFVFTGPACNNNTIGCGCSGNTVSGIFCNNNIGACFCDNVISNTFCGNNIGANFQKNVTSAVFAGNDTGYEFRSNVINGTFCNNSVDASFQNNVTSAVFTGNGIGYEFRSNVISNTFCNNNIGANFSYNAASAMFVGNSAGHNFCNNAVSGYFVCNGIGACFQGNEVSGHFSANETGSCFKYNTVGGGEWKCNKFGNGFQNQDMAAYAYCQSNEFGPGIKTYKAWQPMSGNPGLSGNFANDAVTVRLSAAVASVAYMYQDSAGAIHTGAI